MPDPVQASRFHVERPKDLRVATPGHQYAHHIRTLPARLQALAAEVQVPAGGRVLDYGCADIPYRWFFPSDIDFVAADLAGNDQATLELNADATVPEAAESFDTVMSTQVLEHVADPALYLSECYRVLRPGGRLLLSTHGIFPYHPDPVDYWRWTCAGLRKAVTDAGFEVVRFEGIIGLAATGLQLFQDTIYWNLPARLKRPFAFALQMVVSLADRLEPQWMRDLNGQVFGLVAVKR